MKHKIIFLVQCLLLVCFAGAQSTEAIGELQKIKAYYAGPELKHVAGRMLLTKAGESKAVDKVDFEYWAKDKQIYTKMSYIEILNNNDVYIMVNHKRKTIFGRPVSELEQQPAIGFFDPGQLAKILNTKNAVVNITKAGSNKKLFISGLQNTSFTSVTITYDAGSYKIIAVDAVVNAAQDDTAGQLILNIKYSLSEKTTVLSDPAVFSSSKYLEKNSKGSYIYTQNYKSYQKL